MKLRIRSKGTTFTLAAALVVAPVSLASDEEPDCTVTVYGLHLSDGSRREMEEWVCLDGTIRTTGHHYDASGTLLKVDTAEISADGAVKHTSTPVEAAEEPAPEPDPETAADAAGELDSKQKEKWLNEKFKEWSDAAQKQIGAPAPANE